MANERSLAASMANLHTPPRAPAIPKSARSESISVFVDLNESMDILFQARNVLKSHENPSLMPGNEPVPPLKSPTMIVDEIEAKAIELHNKKMKRVLANRASAARSRTRKLNYLYELERENECQQIKVAFLQSQLTYYQVTQNELMSENQQLKADLEAAGNRNAEKEAEYWALMKEREELLRFINFIQQAGKMANPNGSF